MNIFDSFFNVQMQIFKNNGQTKNQTKQASVCFCKFKIFFAITQLYNNTKTLLVMPAIQSAQNIKFAKQITTITKFHVDHS